MNRSHVLLAKESWRLDWTTLYEEHAQAIARYLARLVGDREVAAELTQDVFIRGMRAESQLRELSATRAWLYRMATNRGIEHLRRRRLLSFVAFTGREQSTAQLFSDEGELVRRALQSIPPDQAATLVLRHHEGFDRHEIAVAMGVGEGAVKTRLERGRRNFLGAYRRLERGMEK